MRCDEGLDLLVRFWEVVLRVFFRFLVCVIGEIVLCSESKECMKKEYI